LKKRKLVWWDLQFSWRNISNL